MQKDAPAPLEIVLITGMSGPGKTVALNALEDAGFNHTAAASRLGLSLRQMRYRIARLNIDMPQGSDAAEDPKQSG